MLEGQADDRPIHQLSAESNVMHDGWLIGVEPKEKGLAAHCESKIIGGALPDCAGAGRLHAGYLGF